MTDNLKPRNPKLIDKYRDINVDVNAWWECVYDDFKEDMAKIGIRVDQIYFSGFWSQGDGACFEGCVTNWELFINSLGHSNPHLIAVADGHWTFSSKHKHNHYYHENTVYFFDDSISLPSGADDDEWAHYNLDAEETLRKAVALAQLAQFQGIEADFKEAFKNHMRTLYRRLEEEYEYRTSDDAVWETLEANDLITEEESAYA
jgi:hypothetical protein